MQSTVAEVKLTDGRTLRVSTFPGHDTGIEVLSAIDPSVHEFRGAISAEGTEVLAEVLSGAVLG